MPPDPNDISQGNANYDPNQTGVMFGGKWYPGPGDPQIGASGGLGGLTPSITNLLDLLGGASSDPGKRDLGVSLPFDRLGDQDNLPSLLQVADLYRKLHPYKEPLPRPTTIPIDKGGTPPDKGADCCSAEAHDNEALKTALLQAQDKIRKGIEDLKTRLAPCDKDGRMTQLLSCIESEGDPINFPELRSHMDCCDIKETDGSVNPQVEARTFGGDDDHPYNHISFNIKAIKQHAKDNLIHLDPPLPAQEILNRVMLHELMHNCFRNRGGDGTYPEVTELDVQVLTNMLGYPRDPKGIDDSAFGRITDDNQKIIDRRINDKLPFAYLPMVNGNFFIYDPRTGEVKCSDSDGTPQSFNAGWHGIFGNGPEELPPLKRH